MFQIRRLDGTEILRFNSEDFERVAHVKHMIRSLHRTKTTHDTVLLRLLLPNARVLPDQTRMDDMPPEVEFQLVYCLPDLTLGPELLESVTRGNKAEVDQKLQDLADPNYRSVNGHTPLVEACLRGRLDIVESLCAAGADINQSSGPKDECINPVFAAADMGSAEVVRHLRELGANPHQPVSNGATPLHAAAFRGHLDLVRLLSTPCEGKNTVRPSTFGAISVAIRKGQLAAVFELLNNFYWLLLWPWLDA